MKRRFRLTRRAFNDLAAAQDWYRARDPDLADQLLVDTYETARAIVEHPRRSPEIEEGTRATLCRKFPYRLYYEIQGDTVVIKAVYHTARDPDRWNDPARD